MPTLKGKKSFFDQFSALINGDEDSADVDVRKKGEVSDWMKEEAVDGELTVDMCQTPNEIIIQTMIAGARPDDLDITINREMVTIKGRRERDRTVEDENYFFRELYWGSFSRTILLPQEIEPDGAEATEKNGLLTIRLPKIDKEKTQSLKVKTR